MAVHEATQQFVQADLVVRAALEPPSRRGPFSVSPAGSPTKPLPITALVKCEEKTPVAPLNQS